MNDHWLWSWQFCCSRYPIDTLSLRLDRQTSRVASITDNRKSSLFVSIAKTNLVSLRIMEQDHFGTSAPM
mgnify:CR=1 FL=1